MNRRLSRASLALFLCITVTLMGCSFASFAAAAEADIPVVIQMVTNITNIVAPGISPEIALAGGLALGGLTILCGSPLHGASKCDPSSLIGQLQNTTDPSAKQSLLQRIQATLSAINSHIGDMLALAKGLPASVGAVIVSAVGIALTTVTLLLSLVGVGVSAKLSAMDKQTLKNIPSAKNLRKQFNAAIGAQYPQAVI